MLKFYHHLNVVNPKTPLLKTALTKCCIYSLIIKYVPANIIIYIRQISVLLIIVRCE